MIVPRVRKTSTIIGTADKFHYRSMNNLVRIIGGGLAGTEAAWQLARRGLAVELFEMRPLRRTEAHATDDLAEVVCSNSLRSDSLSAPAGLLKAEMRQLDSMIIRIAEMHRV